MKKLLSIIVVLSILFACKKDKNNTPIDFEYDYFPIVKGKYATYDVIEIHHDTNSIVKHDTIRYQLKLEIGDTILDLESEIANRYNRYTRDSSTQSWTFKDLWTTKISQNRAELVEENRRAIKMVFKPTSEKTWNMNAFNDLNEEDCSYSYIDVPFTINGIHLDHTITVQEANFTSLIDFQKAYEVYAKGVGLVKKYYKWFEISNFDSTEINTGTEIYYNLTNFGQE